MFLALLFFRCLRDLSRCSVPLRVKPFHLGVLPLYRNLLLVSLLPCGTGDVDLFLEAMPLLNSEDFFDDGNDRLLPLAPDRKRPVHVAVNHDPADIHMVLGQGNVDGLFVLECLTVYADASGGYRFFVTCSSSASTGITVSSVRPEPARSRSAGLIGTQ